MKEAGPVIDCDSHVMEPPDLWERYLEPRFRDRAIRIVERDGVETLLIADEPVLSGSLAGLGGVDLDREAIFAGKHEYMDGCPPASYEPGARTKLLDAWGVDRGVLFPTIGILPFPIEDTALANAYCRAYNTWQAEFFQSAPERVVPIAVVNFHDVEEAARELDRCLALGFKGLFVPPEPVGERRPGEASFDPLWSRLAEANVPGCFHVIVRFSGAAVPFAGWMGVGVGPIFSFGLGAPGQIIPALASVVLDGIFDRHPTLKLASVEAGCGWAGFLMDRLDEKVRYFEKMGTRLARKPSEYIQSNVWFVAEPEERTIGAMLSIVGEDKICWGSDYPHIDSTLEAPDQIRATTATLTPVRRAAVMGGNAVKLFDLG